MEIEPRLAGYLKTGEQVLWTGRPDPRVWLAASDVVMILFGILVVLIGLALSLSGAPWYIVPVGLAFIAFGAYLAIERPMRRAHTQYVITNRRAIVLTPRAMADSPLRGQPVNVRRSRSGRATAHIGTPVRHYALGSDTGGVYYEAPVQFVHVADADAMEAALTWRDPSRREWPVPLGGNECWESGVQDAVRG